MLSPIIVEIHEKSIFKLGFILYIHEKAAIKSG